MLVKKYITEIVHHNVANKSVSTNVAIQQTKPYCPPLMDAVTDASQHSTHRLKTCGL